jgi:hypothetical protein
VQGTTLPVGERGASSTYVGADGARHALKKQTPTGGQYGAGVNLPCLRLAPPNLSRRVSLPNCCHSCATAWQCFNCACPFSPTADGQRVRQHPVCLDSHVDESACGCGTGWHGVTSLLFTPLSPPLVLPTPLFCTPRPMWNGKDVHELLAYALLAHEPVKDPSSSIFPLHKSLPCPYLPTGGHASSDRLTFCVPCVGGPRSR